MNLEFLLALICFFTLHALPLIPRFRPWLIVRLGRLGYLCVYISVSAITFFWLIVAALRAPYIGLWVLRPWQVYVSLVLVALACTLLVAGVATPNSLSLSVRPSGVGVPNGSILRVTRHPLLWALGLWSISHVLVNGDVAAVILFGALATFSLGYMPILDKRFQKEKGIEEWSRLSTGSSNLLFAAYFFDSSRPIIDRTLILSIFGGLMLFTLLLSSHRPIIGVSPLGMIL